MSVPGIAAREGPRTARDGQPLGEALEPSLPPGHRLREETDDDAGFIADLYASTRAEEIAPAPWSDGHKRAFLRSQCALQRAHYRTHYPEAEFLVIEGDGRPIGRLYVWEAERDIRLMDIAIVPERRGRGLGTRLLIALLARAERLGIAVTLHVEPFNRAHGLYRRLGFRVLEDRGVYQFLEWRPRGGGEPPEDGSPAAPAS